MHRAARQSMAKQLAPLSGIDAQQRGISPTTWRSMDPAFVGNKPATIAMGKKAGKANVQIWAEEIGIKLTDDEVGAVLDQVKKKGTEVKRLLTRDEYREITDRVRAAK